MNRDRQLRCDSCLVDTRCGIRVFATGVHKGERFYAIHVPTVDDLDRKELVRAPLRFKDGAHDRIDRTPADTRLM